jgi:hypothetical protein
MCRGGRRGGWGGERVSRYEFLDYTIGQQPDKKQEDAITSMAGTFKKLAT